MFCAIPEEELEDELDEDDEELLEDEELEDDELDELLELGASPACPPQAASARKLIMAPALATAMVDNNGFSSRVIVLYLCEGCRRHNDSGYHCVTSSPTQTISAKCEKPVRSTLLHLSPPKNETPATITERDAQLRQSDLTCVKFRIIQKREFYHAFKTGS